MGVPYNVFWEEDSDMVEVYLKANRLKREEENFDAWLNGLYTSYALSTVLGSMFAKKGSKPKSYLEKPLELYKKEEQITREESSRKLYNKFRSVMSHFNNKKLQERNKNRFKE